MTSGNLLVGLAEGSVWHGRALFCFAGSSREVAFLQEELFPGVICTCGG